jgi:ATP-binding cassette subfamily F protein uup
MMISPKIICGTSYNAHGTNKKVIPYGRNYPYKRAMARTLLLSLEDITLSFGGKPLFQNMNLHIAERDRICLVGKNGVGKTTLMRLMMEDLELDSGNRFVLPGTRIGYLAQRFDFLPEQTVRDFVLSGLPKDEQTEYNQYLAYMVIGPLGLAGDALMRTLSGGQTRRAGLAQALVQDPDILLLDEPTNHLDLETIEWLEQYLKGFRGALVLVSHDRRFLANISQKVLWVDRGNITICPYGYAEFEEWLEEKVAQEARELANLQKKVASEQDWTQGGVSGRRKRNVRRMRELGNLREKLQRDKAAYRQRSQKIEMDALETPNASKIVCEFKQISKAFTREDGSTLPILNDFHHLILKGDRLGILGKNGSGKSSFLKLLSGELDVDSGYIFRSKTLNISYFDQNRSELEPSKTLWETLCPNGGQEVFFGPPDERKAMHVCGYLKKFLFDPKTAHDKVSTLSGGQQNRLLLAKILSNPGNLLILDEPTNDLDMDTLDMLQDMLADFPGTLIIVSHDRDFLDRSVTEMLAFEGDAQIEHVHGGYSDYMRQINHKKANSRAKPEEKAAATPAESIASKKLAKPLAYNEKIEIKQLPETLETLQAELDAMQGKLDEAGLYERDPKAFNALIAQYDETKQTLENTEERWLALEERGMQA